MLGKTVRSNVSLRLKLCIKYPFYICGYPCNVAPQFIMCNFVDIANSVSLRYSMNTVSHKKTNIVYFCNNYKILTRLIKRQSNLCQFTTTFVYRILSTRIVCNKLVGYYVVRLRQACPQRMIFSRILMQDFVLEQLL